MASYDFFDINLIAIFKCLKIISKILHLKMEVKWTSYKINHSKVSNSVELSTIEIRICHLYLVVAKHFHHPEAPFLLTSCSLFLPPLSPSRPQICILSLRIYLLGVFHVGRSIQYVIFFMWLLSLSIMFFRFIYFVTFISTSFLFMTT